MYVFPLKAMEEKNQELIDSILLAEEVRILLFPVYCDTIYQIIVMITHDQTEELLIPRVKYSLTLPHHVDNCNKDLHGIWMKFKCISLSSIIHFVFLFCGIVLGPRPRSTSSFHHEYKRSSRCMCEWRSQEL